MNTKLIIIIGFSYLYGFFEYFMNIKLRRKSNVANKGDKGSLRLLTILIAVGYVLSFSIGSSKIGRVYHWDAFFAIGSILIVIGLTIRILSILTLRQYFTYSVAKIENHKLIEKGLYKKIVTTQRISDMEKRLSFPQIFSGNPGLCCNPFLDSRLKRSGMTVLLNHAEQLQKIRHPGYLGQIIVFIGISASMSNWLSILFMMIPIAVGYGYRIKVEERFMTEQMGENYLKYKKRTKILIPMIF